MRNDRLGYKNGGFEHRLKRLDALVNISLAISKETDLSALLCSVTRETSNVIGAERSTVFLFDSVNDELWSIVAEGEEEEIRFNADAGIAGSVFRSGRPLIALDAYSDKRFNPYIDKKTGFVTKNILAVPIIDPWQRKQGVFEVINKISGDFQEEDANFLSAIASQSAVAIMNVQSFEARKRMFDSLLEVLGESIESRDPVTAGHSQGVMKYAVIIGTYMGLDDAEIETIRYAALLHDYGKIGVPDSILRKPTKLTATEYDLIKKHVVYTQQILSKIDFEEALGKVPAYAGQHHERIDGSGYPLGLTGDEISPGGKIIAVADVFDALTARRHYRGPMDVKAALKVLISGIDTEFDKRPVAALRDYFVEMGRINETDIPI
ncbi:MAG: HD domain-containing protein [bacterium]|nr:HD domain-containing protein [bacterium]